MAGRKKDKKKDKPEVTTVFIDQDGNLREAVLIKEINL